MGMGMGMGDRYCGSTFIHPCIVVYTSMFSVRHIARSQRVCMLHFSGMKLNVPYKLGYW